MREDQIAIHLRNQGLAPLVRRTGWASLPIDGTPVGSGNPGTSMAGNPIAGGTNTGADTPEGGLANGRAGEATPGGTCILEGNDPSASTIPSCFLRLLFSPAVRSNLALLLEFILEQVDLIFLHPQFALEQLLIDVAFTTGLQDRCSHRDWQDCPS